MNNIMKKWPSFGVLIYFISRNGKNITQVGTGKRAEIQSDFTKIALELIDICAQLK